MQLITVFLLLLSLVGCGGNLTSSTNESKSLSIAVSPSSIDTSSTYGVEQVTATFACSANDLFNTTCRVDSVRIDFNGYSYTMPLNLLLNPGEQRSVKLEVFTNSDRELEPFSYLRDVNPSTSATGWTTYSEVIGTIGSKQFAQGKEECTVDPNTGEKTCVGVSNYSGAIPNHTAGTVKITDGTQVLEETTFGVLTGDGSGYINGNSISLSFATPPQVGAFISAMYLNPLKQLSEKPAEGLKVVYNDLILTRNNDFLVDADGNAYAMITNNDITVLRPMGFKNAPLVVVYQAAPFSAYGGERIGEGDGVTTVFSLKTKYAPILEGSLSVFSESRPAEILFYNKYTGDVTVSFKEPPAEGEPIKASYIITEVNMPITITFISSELGNYTVSVPLRVSRP